VIATGVAVAVAAASMARVTVGSGQSSLLGTKILVTVSGRTLYHDSLETSDAVRCVGSCSKAWLPLLVAAGGKPVAGPGVSASLLGTVKRPGSGELLQVTYHGRPLYLFSGDGKSGEVNGQGVKGFGGTWYALAPSGSVVTKSAMSSSQPAAGPSSGSGSGTSSSSGGSVSSGYTGSTVPDPCGTDPNSQACMNQGM
jgi:predicted lipoprotein with Yx(FWY)xxD motif